MSSSILKKLGITAGVLLLLLITYLYQLVPRSQVPFAGVQAHAERILLEQGGKKVEVQKQEKVWKVSSGTDVLFAANESRVITFLAGLEDVHLEDEISDRADRHSEYEVNAESGTYVRIRAAKEAKPLEGIFGKQAPDYAHIYFRYPDKPTVYLARGLYKGELGSIDSKSWRSRQLIDIPEAKIQGIVIEGKGFKTDLVRAGTDTWRLNGKIVDPGPVNSLVGSLAHLHAVDFIDPAAYPAITYDKLTFARVNIKGSDTSAELRIGSQDPKTKQYPASADPAAGLAWLSEAVVKTIFINPSAFNSHRIL